MLLFGCGAVIQLALDFSREELPHFPGGVFPGIWVDSGGSVQCLVDVSVYGAVIYGGVMFGQPFDEVAAVARDELFDAVAFAGYADSLCQDRGGLNFGQ